MADTNLSNTASVTGTYDTSEISLNSNTVLTKIVDSLTIEKAVDKQKWATGELTYTITITNNAENTFETPVLVDVLDPALVSLVTDSVTIDKVATNYQYDEVSGTLTVNLANITVGTTSVITFRVQKK